MDQRKRFIFLMGLGVTLLIAAVVIIFVLPSDEPPLSNTAEYFPVLDPETGKWGFIDNQGKPATPMVFDWAGDYRQGLGLVLLDGAMGYIDLTYEATGDFTINNRFTIDPSDPADMSAFGFYDGLALARNEAGLWGFIDRSGTWAIEPRFAENEDYPGLPVGDFSDGMAWFQVIEMDQRYQINPDGDMVRDEANRPVSENYRRRLYGYIDTEGEVVIAPTYVMAADFGEGLAGFRDKAQDAWGFIDRDGKRAIRPQFEQVGRFSEGLCAVAKHDLWGFINSEGDMVIEPRFAEVRQFSDGLAPAREGTKWGYINPEGQWVLEPVYDNYEDHIHPRDPSPFENGLARVTLNEQTIYINTAGNRVWPAGDE